jgi:hypothetical protein
MGYLFGPHPWPLSQLWERGIGVQYYRFLLERNETVSTTLLIRYKVESAPSSLPTLGEKRGLGVI